MKIAKMDREALRRELAAKSYSAEDIALVMQARYGIRPRLAFRWAHGMTLEAVAAEWNQQDASGRAPMTNSRVSDYERWPDGGKRPTVYVLLKLAKIYGTTAGRLLDQRDYESLNGPQLFEMVELCRNGAARRMEEEADSVESGNTCCEDAVDEAVEALEVARRAEMSDLGTGTLESLDRAVDRLCRDYPSTPPLELLFKVRRQFNYVNELLEGKATLDQHRHLLVAGGWLSVLLACLQFDVGAREAAEACRDAAYRLGHQAGHQEIMAWSFELLAWFALVDERLGDAISCARAGQELTSNTFVSAQLAAQEAKAWARRGAEREADEAMAQVAVRLDRLPTPIHPEHHLVFDATKFSFYATTCYRWLGRHNDAKEHAHEVLLRSVDATGPNDVWPSRRAEVHLDLGVIALREGNLDEACHLGSEVLDSKCLRVYTLRRFAELDALLAKQYGEAGRVRELHERFVAESQRLAKHVIKTPFLEGGPRAEG
ncbi:MAG: helix-turn-helix domain-containing protein [Egibacteraceae bacterium]